MNKTRVMSVLVAALTAIPITVGLDVSTAPPAAADGCYTWPRKLWAGMRGRDVRQLQIRVAGWAASGRYLAVDGIFGNGTKAAVRRFQAGYGLGVDGVAGAETFRKIYGLQDNDCTPIHFTYSEFDNGCGIGGFEGGRVSAATAKRNALRQMWKAEALRRKLGDRPLYVSSAFRSVSCNRRTGGSANSQHMYGTAADLTGSPSLCRIVRKARTTGHSGILGPGYPGHGGHIHLDSRAERGLGFAWRAPRCGVNIILAGTGGPVIDNDV
jgi:zinc D-Ala-D-Ala carboxypeptidase